MGEKSDWWLTLHLKVKDVYLILLLVYYVYYYEFI